MGGKRALLASLIALALMPAASARANEVWGVSVNHVINDDFTPARWDAPLAAVRSSGVAVARTDATWGWAEPAAPQNGVHSFDWTRLDAIATALAQHGLRWMPVLGYSAPWAASDSTDVHTPPRSNDDYAAFAGAFAARYGRFGSFWAEHPELEALPVNDYEIWNEPNGAWFWAPKPNPTRYGDMYLKARAAIHAADPEGRAVIGGITNDPGYLAAMYRNHSNMRGNVDALAWHPYGTDATDALDNVRAARAVLLGVGDGSVPIYVTELGWPTQGTGFAYLLEEPRRSKELEKAADRLFRSDCAVTKIVPYTWTAAERDPDYIEDWYGLYHPDGTPTPSAAAFQRVIDRSERTPVTSKNQVRLCRDLYPRGGSTDTDHDGRPDSIDPDDDNDGVPDWQDGLPRNRREQVDTDRDGKGDKADKDDDNDGISDKREKRIHTYRDDVDTDDDGIRDGAEKRTSPTRADTDRDGIPDGLEQGISRTPPEPRGRARGTNPRRFRPDRDPRSRTNVLRADTDRDGLNERREDLNRNGRLDPGETDPRRADTDGDGVNDRKDEWPRDPTRPYDPLDNLDGAQP
jgi:hypothetical protein